MLLLNAMHRWKTRLQGDEASVNHMTKQSFKEFTFSEELLFYV